MIFRYYNISATTIHNILDFLYVSVTATILVLKRYFELSSNELSFYYTDLRLSLPACESKHFIKTSYL